MNALGQRFRLADDPENLGLHCDGTGLTLAGVPLLRTTITGFAPRPTDEVCALLEGVYGDDFDAARVLSTLGVISAALNRNELSRAMVATLHLKLPELDHGRATTLSVVDNVLVKYNPDEPRDRRGRWTTGNGIEQAGSAAATKPPSPPTHIRGGHSRPPAHLNIRAAAPRPKTNLPRASGGISPPTALQTFQSLYPKFQSQFDDLGPVEFSKKVISFGGWLSRNDLSHSQDLAAAKAQYTFLEDRLSFWLGYNYLPPQAHGNLISAAYTLQRGALEAGLVDSASWPKSMNAVATAAMAYEGSNPAIAMHRLAAGELEGGYQPVRPHLFTGVGGVADRLEVKIFWGDNIFDQGANWERYLGTQLPKSAEFDPIRRVWDFYDKDNHYVVSAKTLDTTSYTYAHNPDNIYARLSKYIDEAAEYGPTRINRKSDIPVSNIETKQIHLATPDLVSPEQQMQIFRAIQYGRTRGVSVVVTRVR